MKIGKNQMNRAATERLHWEVLEAHWIMERVSNRFTWNSNSLKFILKVACLRVLNYNIFSAIMIIAFEIG